MNWQRVRVELGGLGFDKIDDAEHLLDCLTRVVNQLDGEVKSTLLNKFQPQGVSVVVTSERSMVVLHSWPEHGVVTLDVSAHIEINNDLLEACQRTLTMTC